MDPHAQVQSGQVSVLRYSNEKSSASCPDCVEPFEAFGAQRRLLIGDRSSLRVIPSQSERYCESLNSELRSSLVSLFVTKQKSCASAILLLILPRRFSHLSVRRPGRPEGGEWGPRDPFSDLLIRNTRNILRATSTIQVYA